eukprot:snap_masked-scaffold_2-processed-gene-27.37-mRNA-1 protein AED:1.00 eAED:1.00 QI:0/0/0/0/1/1/3/0/79
MLNSKNKSNYVQHFVEFLKLLQKHVIPYEIFENKDITQMMYYEFYEPNPEKRYMRFYIISMLNVPVGNKVYFIPQFPLC